jgi:Tol biopolymer transport system component
MFLQKLTIGAVCGLTLTFACLAALYTGPNASAKDPPKPPVRLALRATSTDQPKPPAARPAGPGAIIIGRDKGAYWVVSPDGKKQSEVEVPPNTNPAGGARLSPDGKRAAYVLNTETAPRPVPREVDEIKPWPFKVVVRTLDKPDGAKEWDLPANHLSLNWTPDGKKLIASKIMSPRWTEFECVLLDPDTGKTESLDIPANVRVMDCGKDGKTFVVQTYDAKSKKCQLAIARLGDKDVTVLSDLHDRGNRPTEARLSPNGKTILFIDADPERKDAHKWGCSQRVYTIDLATKQREALTDFPDNARAWGITWSPDGKKLAYTWVALDDDLLKKDRWDPEEVQKDTEGFLIVADANGKNVKTIATDKGRFAMSPVLTTIDWR